jgi:hypothetical protein
MLHDLENKFNFKYPDFYINLYNDGMLDWGKLGPNWTKDIYPKIRGNPPFLLFANDFKIIPLDEIEKNINKLNNFSNNKKYIPFGKNGAGDLYSIEYTDKESIRAICIVKRNEEIIYLAKNFDDFIFRELLGTCVQINPYDLEDEPEFLENIKNMLNSHKKYITNDRYLILERIYNLPIQEEDEDNFGMISIDDYFDILKKEIKQVN